jgi:hypothetical protein
VKGYFMKKASIVVLLAAVAVATPNYAYTAAVNP